MRSPFKFLDAYTLDDKGQFFGRETETEALYKMVFKTPLVLAYGLSGTGKTSLIQCGLASCFDGPDWLPLFIRRQEDINRSFRKTLRDALGGHTRKDIPETVRQLYRHYLRPVYLIFDQFEELFILGSWEEQQQLAHGLKKLLAADLPCTILLVIREEYLGRLYAFEKVIPTLFDFRLRVEPMNASRVKTVLTSSFQQFNIALEQPEEDSLQLIVDNISAGKSGIQLPYLQVYLDMLYQEDYQRSYGEKERAGKLPPLEFSRGEISAFGSIEHVLEKFLRQQEIEIQRFISDKHPGFPAGAVHEILDVFVTEEGTKRPISYSRQKDSKYILLEESTLKLLPAMSPAALSGCIERLEQSRLIRFSDNNIELAHDSLAALIDEQRTDEQRQLNEVKRRIQSNFLDHRQTGEYLSRKQLNAYEDYLPKLSLEPAVQEFIQDSQAHAEKVEAEEKIRQQRELELVHQKLETEKRSARRQRFFTIITSIVALIAFTLGAWALYQRNEKEKARQALQESFFTSQVANAQSLKSQGLYEAAIKQLDEAIPFIASPAQQAESDSLLSQYRQVAQLVNTADSLALADATLITALEKYRAANLISSDGLIRNKIRQTEKAISQNFADYKNRAANILEYGGCEHAMGLLKKAQQLKPEDEWTQKMIRRCGGAR
ncbi:MAG: ATP-binding protein [Lewinellaceae bacterium]|nr:ATP-binding protein [Phaeodactylibacter sp.]MCB0612526.1 ATP-binding protein [Phaeodactylibacter sp.]MCB9351761.1 ATP-binding protein [Lewinellaceae bacterium]